MQRPPLVQLDAVARHFPGPAGEPIVALRDISLRAHPGELVALTGRSGSGKSTLLNLVAGLDRPTRGHIRIGETALDALDEDALARWRGAHIGVVFQFFQLLPTLTARENIRIALDFVGTVPRAERDARAAALLERVGIAAQGDQLPATLAGGQQQRAAIARALANAPALLVADEPTGNLDSRTAASVLELFTSLAADGTTVIVVTHDTEVAAHADHVVHLVDGAVRATA